MHTEESIKRTIDTVHDLHGVVRTMKVLAAVNIRQYESASEQLTQSMEMIRIATEIVCWCDPHYFEVAPTVRSQKIGLIAFGSDQGMCGGFNEATVNAIDQFFEAQVHPTADGKNEIPIVTIGRRLADRLDAQKYPILRTVDLPASAIGMTEMLEGLLTTIDTWQQQFDLDAVTICFHHRVNQTQSIPKFRKLLPVLPVDLIKERKRRWSGRTLPLVTLPLDQLWLSIAREYIFLTLYRACAESLSSENAARIAAMQSAEKHIESHLDELQHNYQQLRQQSITEELLDVVNGYEALTSGSA